MTFMNDKELEMLIDSVHFVCERDYDEWCVLSDEVLSV